MFRDPALLPDPFPETLRPIVWAKTPARLTLARFPRDVVPRLAGDEFALAAPFPVAYRLAGEMGVREIVVPRGFITDLASVPRFLRPLVGVVGPHLEAAVVHDYLYVQRWRGGETAARRAFADGMMLALMRDARFALRWPVYGVVRTFGGVLMRRPPEGRLLAAFSSAGGARALTGG
ncbi:MAG: DUF1353 domain-containing protein [Pseudomonadota bacterium]